MSSKLKVNEIETADASTSLNFTNFMVSNDQAVSQNITTGQNKNVAIIGPLTINTGYTVTVASGSNMVIL